MSEYHAPSSLGWQLLDAAVYLAAGLCVGVLLAVVLGRGQLPRVPDDASSLTSPADR